VFLPIRQAQGRLKLRGKRILVFFLLPFYFLLARRADSSIIQYSGFDSFEAATALFVVS